MSEREGVRPEEEQQAARQFHRPRGSDIYLIPGKETDRIKAHIPQFMPELFDLAQKVLEQRGLRKAGIFIKTDGEEQQTLYALEWERKEGEGSLEIHADGEWTKETEIPRGREFKSPYTGRFQRKADKKNAEPIAKEKQEVGPGDAIGMIVKGKNNRWPVKLPEDHPGGTITKFTIEVEGDVEKGKTVICYIEEK